VLIHGGGFRVGSRRAPAIVRVAEGLAARGIAVANIDYRLMPQRPVPSQRVAGFTRALPDAPLAKAASAAVDDTLTAIDYLRRHADDLGIDTDRLGLVGGSAGAITADHVAYALDDVDVRRPEVRFVGSLWGGLVVPGARIERGEASLFAVHGTADPTLNVALSDRLTKDARARRIRTEYHRLRGAGHGFDRTRFFDRRVAGRQTAYDRLLRFAAAELR
jgi:acetyl esterase/lipase